MPEGPEVKTITDYLDLNYANEKLVAINILSGRYKKKPLPGIQQINLPATINRVNCKGKFIYFVLSDDKYIFNTLGMTGTWTSERKTHSRVVFSFESGRKLYYTDVRNFGTLKIVLGTDVLSKKLKSLGPDLLNEEVDYKTFKESFLRKKRTITENMMDQSLISGVGNYLKSEILYASKISPYRQISSLTDQELEKIYKNTKNIIKFSYSTGGATIKDYYSPDGTKGSFSKRFAVYNQSSDPLGNKVIKETTADKRTTHWVPVIQK